MGSYFVLGFRGWGDFSVGAGGYRGVWEGVVGVWDFFYIRISDRFN